MATNTNEDNVLDDVAPAEANESTEELDYVVEGSEEAEALKPKAAEDPLGGLSKEQIALQLKTMQEQLTAEKQLRETFTKLQNPQVVVQAPANPPSSVPEEKPEEKQKRLNQLFLENPAAAMAEAQKDALNPLLGVMIKNQESFSKAILLKDAAEKPYYDKYKDEVEAEVKAMPPAEKIQSAEVYQVALERVKSRHQGDILQDLVQAKVQETLKSLGIDPAKLAERPAVASLAGKPASSAPVGASKPKVVIPKWVVDEADRQGVSPSVMYELKRSKGLVR